jgi:hypothetical protein
MLVLLLLGLAQDAGAGSALRVEMTCEHAAAPGRVRCDVEARVAAGEAIRWGDVEIVATPPFASALRGRVGPRDASTHDDEVWRWPLALAAREHGAGDVGGRVRLVVCAKERCTPRIADVHARIVVGP